MNSRTVGIQIVIFSAQWALMLVGFWLLANVIAPTKLVPPSVAFDHILDSAVKAGIALAMSVFWLLVWDREVRRLIYRRER